MSLPRAPVRYRKTAADKKADAEGCRWDRPAAERVRTFFRTFLRHSKGEWAGQAFELLPWQWEDVILPLFAWKRPDGTRRFRKAYIEVPKKNGKSTLAAGLSLYLLVGDGEQGAEVYSAAADREQASIIYREAAQMVRASTELREHLQTVDSTKRVVFPGTGSWYKALSADAYRQEGLNIHGLLFDELHAQKNRDLWDALTYGGAVRRQPLLIAITTAGWDRHSICWEQRQYAQQILDGTFDDISFFPYIACAEEDDDWTDPKVWEKANPSWGSLIKPEEMAEACAEAQASPTKENAFKRYRLNIWTEQDVRWLRMEAWDECGGAVDAEALKGRECFAALDLSTTTDLAALALLFPLDGGRFAWLPHFWIPADNARERERRDKVPYLTWAKQGLIELTDGNVIDYSKVMARTIEYATTYTIRELAVDRFQAEHMMQLFAGEGLEVVPYAMSFGSMTAPTKKLETLILSGAIDHGNNPVLRWMARNVSVATNGTEDLRPCKKKSVERIDGIVAAIMALGRAIVTDDGGSVYDKRGVLTL